MDENLNVERNETNENGYQDYIDTINDLKANTVSREKYDQLLAEKKDLVNALKNNSQVNLVEPEKEVDLDELRHDLFTDTSLTNLQFADKLLTLRNKILDEDNIDIFMGQGPKYVYNKEDQDNADLFGQVLEECLEIADGNNEVFMTEFGKRVADDNPTNKSRRR